jgi:hypothetical protein
MKLLEITKNQAEALYNEGIVVYLHLNGNSPDDLNTFIMRNDSIDASLNMYQKYAGMPLADVVEWIENRQAEPVRFWTLNEKELFILPI